MALHRRADRQQSADVVGVIRQRLRDRLADRLVRGKVHDRVDAPLRKQRVDGRGVADAGLHEVRLDTAQALQPLQHLGRAVGEVVDADDMQAGGLQREPGVRGDVAGRAGQQDGRHGGVRGCRPVGLRRIVAKPRRQAGDAGRAGRVPTIGR